MVRDDEFGLRRRNNFADGYSRGSLEQYSFQAWAVPSSRMMNADVIDLYVRVGIGTRIVVL